MVLYNRSMGLNANTIQMLRRIDRYVLYVFKRQELYYLWLA